MRIVAGKYGGRRLQVPKGLAVRPTADRVKEAVFSMLGGSVEGARVLDMFAGSGALGLEAISRGADRAVLADRDRRNLEAARRNVDALGVGDAVAVVLGDTVKDPGRLAPWGPFDLFFIDPPYAMGLAAAGLAAAHDAGLAASGARAVVETGREEDLPADPPWILEKRKNYGQTSIWVWVYSPGR